MTMTGIPQSRWILSDEGILMADLIYGFHSISPLLWQSPEKIAVIYLDNKRRDKQGQNYCS